jgi:hypothetical protein
VRQKERSLTQGGGLRGIVIWQVIAAEQHVLPPKQTQTASKKSTFTAIRKTSKNLIDCKKIPD